MAKNEIKPRLKGMIVKVSGESAWYVGSDTDPDKMYKVTLHSCECKAFEFRNGYCKHMDRVMNMLLEEIDNMEKEDLVKLLELSIQLVQERKEKERKVKLEYNP